MKVIILYGSVCVLGWVVLAVLVGKFFRYLGQTELPDEECLNCDFSNEGGLCDDCLKGEAR